MGRLKRQALSRPMIEPIHDVVYLCLRQRMQAECGRLVMRVADRDQETMGASLGLDFVRVLLFDPTSGKRL